MHKYCRQTSRGYTICWFTTKGVPGGLEAGGGSWRWECHVNLSFQIPSTSGFILPESQGVVAMLRQTAPIYLASKQVMLGF